MSSMHDMSTGGKMKSSNNIPCRMYEQNTQYDDWIFI